MRWTHVTAAGIAFFGLVLVGAAGTDTAKKLVGVWEITKSKGAPPGATVEFTQDGKMKLRAKMGEKELKIDGTYEVKGMEVVSHLNFGGKTKTETSKIKKLTENELIVQDEKGSVEEYKRAK